MKIKVDEDTCIGCGACANTCDNFEMVDTGNGYKARVKNDKVAEAGCNKEAEEACPVDAIKVE